MLCVPVILVLSVLHLHIFSLSPEYPLIDDTMSPTPRTFSKYFTNISLPEIMTRYVAYYIARSKTMGVTCIFNTSTSIMKKTYYIEPGPDPQQTYNIELIKGQFEQCDKGTGLFDRADLLFVVFKLLQEYLGDQGCPKATDENLEKKLMNVRKNDRCDVWGNEDLKVYYYALQSNGYPYVIQLSQHEMFWVTEFREGEDAFDESVEFKLPCDKSECH